MIANLLALFLAANTPATPIAICLGPFCLDEHARELQRTYGAASVQNGGNTLCYEDRGLYVHFQFDDHDENNPPLSGLYVGKEPSAFCPASTKARRHFPKLMTPSGITIGDPLDKVQKLYADRPQFEVQTFDDGSQSVTWDVCGCELTTIDVRLEHGRVVSITLDDSE